MLPITVRKRRRIKGKGQGKNGENCVYSFPVSKVIGMLIDFGQLYCDLKFLLIVLHSFHFFDIIIISSLFLAHQHLL